MKPVTVFSIVFLVAAALITTACTDSRSDKHTIGFIGALSGDKAKIGTSVLRGARMAHNASNASVEFHVEDDKGNPEDAITAYKKLRNVNDVDAVIGVLSPQGNALGPLAQKDGTLYCDVGASDSSIFTNRSHVLSHWVSPANEAERYIEHATALGYETIATIEPQQAGVKAVMHALQREAAQHDISLDRHRVPQTQKDFRTTVQKIENADVDAVFFVLFPGQALPALKQLEEAGVELPLTSMEIYAYYGDDALSYLDGDDWFVYASTPRQSFMKEFRDTYPNATVAMAGHGYDCYQLLTEALEHGGGSSEQAVRYLRNISDYPGMVGPLTYDGGRIDSPAIVKEWRNGSFVPLEE